ncbi:protocadherin Fat 4-like [Ptychodera flava]|uniref:protocadherin Fat 4-like n=1 Tax=Ptychodera flava TaxID=63121 RepID=UPI00396A4B46
MSFTLENAEYSEELADRTSPKFRQLEKDIIGEISQLYANNSDFERVEITEFRPGSIVVVMNIVLHDNATESAIDNAVESATSHLSMNGILNYTTSNVTRQKDYCYGKPCQNDGICVSGSADYVCYCRDNYIGKRCEHEYIALDRGSLTLWFFEGEKVTNPIMEIRSLVRNPESVLEYGLKNSDDSVFFKLDTKRGQLNTTLGSFDRESRESYLLEITLTGRASRSVLDITIHVKDINDNNPVFQNTPYYSKVMEYSPVGTLVTTITAADPDQNNDLNYSLSSDKGSLKYFSNLVSVESETGRVILTGTLNRKMLKEDGYLVDNENVAIPIEVSDGATSTRGTIFLDVVPLFVRPTITSNETTRLQLSLPEDAAVGSFVANVRLPESDDVEYTYRIFKADNYNNFSFAVNETSGVVRTTQTLDREERDDYGFYVFALDNNCLTSTEVYIELRVEDVNDNAPEFPETSYSAEIREDATSAQTVFIQPPIRATDKDIGTNAEIAFSLSGQGHEQFTIDPETGTVKTREESNLDYETTKMYTLTLTARDMNGDAGGHWNSVPLIIYITDYNDNKPLFSHPNVNLQISEATQPGSLITSINATDADEDLNAALLYFISEGSQGKFKVDSHTGELSVIGHLDRETTEFYDLKIIVRDQGLHVLDNAVHVLINVTDVNDNAPLFTELFYSAHVAENATWAFQVISVTAGDADTGDNGRVTYALDIMQEFVIDPMTGIVTTRLPLDRENVESYDLVVTATDNGDVRLSSTATVRIVIDDVNDNIPKFSKTEYTSTLLVRSSKLRNGTIATIVSASDPDSGENGKVVYSVDDAEQSQTFSIDASGVVRVNRDKLTSSKLITFNITARNDVSPAQFDRATVIIVLEHPLKTLAFDVDDYEFRVTENVIADLGNVRVLNSSGITYKLPFDIPGIHINSTSGVITLISSLDREINPQVIFNVFAQSEYIAEGLAFTTVTITVEDVNDNPPYFEYPDELYHVVAGGLRENHLNDTFLTVRANDEDSGHNSQIQYSIIDGNEDAKFNIDSDTGVISVISEVDREMVDHYILTIMAQDTGEDDRLNSTTQIFIPIVDENDNAPNITIDSSNVVVQENVLIGTEVAFVRATDDDSGQNAEIVLELIDDADGYFQIDALSGSIQTNKDIDYETQEKYDIAVIAVDKGLPSSRTSETLRIEVLVIDYNDNSPHFTGQPYTVSLAKDSDPGSSVLQVSATDDDSGRNANLTYTIIGTDKCGLDLFNVDETTGVLKHTRVLYEEPAGTCLLTIRVMDDGQERLSDIAMVEVNITEVNHPPQFESDVYSATVPENEPVGSDINTSPNPPKAIDDDHGPNAEVVYRILGGNEDGFFSIDSATGLIKVASSLDREIVDSVHMLIVAHDSTVDPKSATANVTITIDDVNDNAPELPPQETAVVSQDSKPGSFVTTINATDADSGPNAECSFSFLGEAKLDRVKVEQPNDLFAIDDFSGNITTKDALYRIVGASTVSIELLVIAENRQPLVATSSQNWRGLAVTWLTVLFTFDYTPVCGQDVYQVSIPEDTFPGTLLNISFEENSNSLKPIPALTYAIKSGNDRNSFGIIGDSVVDIQVQNVLDVRTYNLTISVSTPDPLHGKGTCFVVVEVFQVVTAPPSSTTLPSGKDDDLSSVALVAIIALSTVSTLLLLLVILLTAIYRGKNASLRASLKASGLMPSKPKKSIKLGFYEWLVMRAATINKKGAKYKDHDDGQSSEMTERYVRRPLYASNRNAAGGLTAESDYLDAGDVEDAYEQIPAEQDMVYTEPDNYLTMASVGTSTQTNPFGISESEIDSPSRDFSA